MSIKPLQSDVCEQSEEYRLKPFDNLMAPVVASWVKGDHELFWLAPNTPPPLTAAKVAAWSGPRNCPMLLMPNESVEPLGYVELNAMGSDESSMWLGHCLVKPDCRGRGVGQMMVELLLEEAFIRRQARDVCLIVFPDNHKAINCYRRAGFGDLSPQNRLFYTTGQHHQMLCMSINRRQYTLRS